MRIQLQGTRARLARFLQVRLVVAAEEVHMRGGQARPGASEIWIKLSRSLKHL